MYFMRDVLHQILNMYCIVEALQLHSNTQPHWSSGSTICSLPRGAVVRVPGMYSLLQWKQVLLLAMSRYIGDSDAIHDHWLR
jgi:hypothetical protein